jgi:DNA-binding response OmpR family regulator
VTLARLELRLLAALIKREGRVCTREVLLDLVWGNDVNILDRTVDVTVARLRRKLGRAAEYLESVRSVGYRFSAPAPP